MNKRKIIGTLGAFIPKFQKNIRILTYHRITPDVYQKDPHLCVSPSLFQDQLCFLKKNHYRLIDLDEAIRQMTRGVIRDSKQVVLTFDDGFRDNYDFAFPLLKKFNAGATVFPIVSKIGSDSDFLDKEQIIEMRNCGITFGSHTLTHPMLPQISTKDAWDEIYRSRAQLESILQVPVRSFAYPAGHFTKLHCQMVKNAGYRYAVSIAPGGDHVESDLYQLKRTEIAPHDSLYDFRNKLHGGFDWVHRIVQFQQGLYPVPQKSKEVQ